MNTRITDLDVNFKCRCGSGKEKSWHLVCPDCWERLPSEMRDELWEAYKENKGSERHRIAVRKCIGWLRGGWELRADIPKGRVILLENGHKRGSYKDTAKAMRAYFNQPNCTERI